MLALTRKPNREEIVRAGRRYIGTPYHHQAALAGAGCDCLGLIRGVWRDLYGSEPEAPPPYSPDWGDAGAVEHMLEAAARHMVPVALDAAEAGDVLVFRLKPGVVAKHAAILTSRTTMIHAQSEDRVREVTANTWWWRHAAGAFGFPLGVTISGGSEPRMARNTQGCNLELTNQLADSNLS